MNNITMGIKETELQDVDWLHFAQDRNEWVAVVNAGMNHNDTKWVSQNTTKLY